ncbi:MAG: SpoIIE family protein phosphatase [Spirochaetia bacterium]|nr:SpoIIE family protein phosphatase [Spirochaetia bacterium]
MNPPSTYVREFSLKDHCYRVRVYAPSQSTTSDVNGGMHVHFAGGGTVSAAWMTLSDASLRIYLVVGDIDLPDQALRAFLDQGTPAVVTSELERAGREAQTSFRAALVEIGTTEEDMLVQVSTAGLPPLALVTGGDFTLPIRSGVPAGVVPDRRIFPQSMEWNVGDALILYTDYSGPEGALQLREFHDRIKTGDVPVPLRGIALSVEFVS